MTARRRTLLAVAALGAATLAACGLPQDGDPRLIPAKEVPFDLAGPAEQDAPALPPGEEQHEVIVYLVKDVDGQLKLSRQTRKVAGRLNLQTILQNLMAGGTYPDERTRQLRNLVPGGELVTVQRPPQDTETETTEVAAGAACAALDTTSVRIEVEKEFFDRFPTISSQQLAIGQIVLTAMDYAPANGKRVSAVQFTVDGHTRTVPTALPNKWVSYLNSRSYYQDLVDNPELQEPAENVESGVTCDEGADGTTDASPEPVTTTAPTDGDATATTVTG